jgi:hypothetical protein
MTISTVMDIDRPYAKPARPVVPISHNKSAIPCCVISSSSLTFSSCISSCSVGQAGAVCYTGTRRIRNSTCRVPAFIQRLCSSFYFRSGKPHPSHRFFFRINAMQIAQSMPRGVMRLVLKGFSSPHRWVDSDLNKGVGCAVSTAYNSLSRCGRPGILSPLF